MESGNFKSVIQPPAFQELIAVYVMEKPPATPNSIRLCLFCAKNTLQITAALSPDLIPIACNNRAVLNVAMDGNHILYFPANLGSSAPHCHCMSMVKRLFREVVIICLHRNFN